MALSAESVKFVPHWLQLVAQDQSFPFIQDPSLTASSPPKDFKSLFPPAFWEQVLKERTHLSSSSAALYQPYINQDLVRIPKLEAATYAHRFLPLLAEELRATIALLASFTLYNVHLRRTARRDVHGVFYNLATPVIREGYPPIHIMDRVILKQLRW